jgi:hypothetical protein
MLGTVALAAGTGGTSLIAQGLTKTLPGQKNDFLTPKTPDQNPLLLPTAQATQDRGQSFNAGTKVPVATGGYTDFGLQTHT